MSQHLFTRRRSLHLALSCAIVELGTGHSQAQAMRLWHRSAIAFGTVVSIKLEAPDAAAAEAAFAAGFAEIRHIDRVASLKRDDSETFRLNRDGFLDHPDPALIDMLGMAAELHNASDHAFDISIQPLWLAFDAAARLGAWPDAGEIAAIRRRVNMAAVRFDEGRVSFKLPGMAITLNGLAQGYAADRVARALALQGITRAFLDTGELEAIGHRPDGTPWSAAIQHPRQKMASTGTAQVQGCLATSGDYQYFWSQDFAKNHIVDPRTGVSPSEFASVSVLASSGLLADALSTAIFVTGRAAGMKLLAKYGAQAQFVTKSGEVENTARFPLLAKGQG